MALFGRNQSGTRACTMSTKQLNIDEFDEKQINKIHNTYTDCKNKTVSAHCLLFVGWSWLGHRKSALIVRRCTIK